MKSIEELQAVLCYRMATSPPSPEPAVRCPTCRDLLFVRATSDSDAAKPCPACNRPALRRWESGAWRPVWGREAGVHTVAAWVPREARRAG